jgi:hypothetical protein
MNGATVQRAVCHCLLAHQALDIQPRSGWASKQWHTRAETGMYPIRLVGHIFMSLQLIIIAGPDGFSVRFGDAVWPALLVSIVGAAAAAWAALRLRSGVCGLAVAACAATGSLAAWLVFPQVSPLPRPGLSVYT